MVNMIQGYQPTSKVSLKQFCIVAAKGDVEEAQKLYDFYMKDMDELPVFDPTPPTWVDNTKNAVSSFFDFFKENKEGFGQVYDMVRGLMAARGKAAPIAEEVTEALPEIN